MTSPSAVTAPVGSATIPAADDGVPHYLKVHYWWAYIHPWAVRVFERQWLVNLILWGNYRQLRDSALSELGGALPGRTLQVACVYGDLTTRLCQQVAAGGGALDIVDILPIQLENLRRKLSSNAPARLLARNSAALGLPDASYDRAILFFLLHEQPADVRRRTLDEAFRVVKPGGTILIVDFARPNRWHPLRYLWLPLLKWLEPFAPDLWRSDITTWLPEPWASKALRSRSSFGGLYQQVVISR
jgi:ubiquinone/menaquinone biosynthesis C-methylase UbiE